MDSIRNIFRTQKHNQSVSVIQRGIKTYNIQWSDVHGYAHHVELPIDEVRILQELLQIADFYERYGIWHGNVDNFRNQQIENGPNL